MAFPVRTCFTILTFFTLALAITILGLTGHVLSYASSKSAEYGVVYVRVDSSGNTVHVKVLPGSLDSGSAWSFCASGIGGLIDVLLNIGMLLFCRNNVIRFGRKSISVYPVLAFVCTASIIRSTVTMIYGWVAEAMSPSFDGNQIAAAGMRVLALYPATAGTFQYGKWFCGLADHAVGEGSQQFVHLCSEIQAYKALGIVIDVAWIIGLVLVCLMWNKARKGRGKAVENPP